MNWENFLLMRNELLLTAALVVAISGEIFVSDRKKGLLIDLMILVFMGVTIVGFLPPFTGSMFGGMFRNSDLTNLMKNVLNIGTLIILFQSVTWLKSEKVSGKTLEYFILIFSTLMGMNFMISSGDFLMFYLGLELATIPMAGLAAFDKWKNKSAEAGIKLILSSALSSGVLLYGISMIYGTTGSLYFDLVMPRFTLNPVSILALIFFFSGMAFKISLVPFHLWTADVYEGSPINVTSYLSVISKGAAVFILTILMFTVFKAGEEVWRNMMYIIAILTMTIGNLFAIRQKNLKRFLAFSSIAQAGFILLGIMDGSELGMTSVIYFVLIYIFSNLAAFGVIAIISARTGKETMPDYDGLYLTNPKLSLTMMLALFSLAGIPPVAGFFAKFFLFTAAAHQGYYWLVLIAVLNATISLYYYLLVVKAMFINKSESPIAYFKSDAYTRIGLLACVLGIFLIGFLSAVYEYIRIFSFGIQ